METKINAFNISKQLKQCYQFIVAVCIVLLSTSNCIAQLSNEQNANWIIGNTNRLDFKTNQVTATGLLPDSNTPSSKAVTVSDGCSNLLFVTDGVKIWRYLNGNYQLVEEFGNYEELSSIRENVLVVPRPYYANSFFIIVVMNNVVNYYEYVVSENSLGTINHLGYLNSSSIVDGIECTAITSFLNFDNSTYKLMLYDKLNQNLETYNVETDGIHNTNTPINFSNVFPSSDVYFDQIKLFPDGSYYVLGTNDGKLYSGLFSYISDINYIDYYTFSYSNFFNNSYPITGIEFSPDYQSLYYTNGYQLFKSSLGTYSYPYSYNSNNSLNISAILEGMTLGDLRVGKDGNIYGAIQGSSSLLKIENSDNSNTFVTSIELAEVNVSSSLSTRVIRHGGSPYIYEGYPIFDQIDPVCEGTNPPV